ncbi:MAG: type II toxin-antitoxin system MqsA family antitoxin [Deltaproteobacteria bacterium]|nr:type II toxin-antitoxin system MqsA family antitoxin [Deltaproteobacteria bacterium]
MASLDGDKVAAGTCAFCGGRLGPGIVTAPFVRGERVVTVKGVPASVCGDCSEPFLAGAVVDSIQRIIERVADVDAEVVVARYRSAA